MNFENLTRNLFLQRQMILNLINWIEKPFQLNSYFISLSIDSELVKRFLQRSFVAIPSCINLVQHIYESITFINDLDLYKLNFTLQFINPVLVRVVIIKRRQAFVKNVKQLTMGVCGKIEDAYLLSTAFDEVTVYFSTKFYKSNHLYTCNANVQNTEISRV